MGNPFAGVAQMGINEFWSWLQHLSDLGKQVKADLSSDRAQLMALYTQARNDTDAARGHAHMKALDPLVHNNSALRLRYQSLAAKFNEAVNGASALLKKAGLSTPQLSGLGVAPLIILGVALAAAAAAWGIYQAVRVGTDAQRKATTALAKLLADPNATPAEKLLAAQALAKKAREANPFDLGNLTPVLAIVLAIMVAPTVLKMVESRRAAA
jgi:hypothetical protein